MKQLQFAFLLCLGNAALWAQEGRSTKNEGDWSAKQAVLKKTTEAELTIRVGDIDNLNFGWAEGYNPFSGKSTDSHAFPWEPDENDPKGTDRIFTPSSFIKNPELTPCGSDGYSGTPMNPQAIRIPLAEAKGLTIKAASIQLFIDDFQSPNLCSRFRVWLNGKVRCPQMEEQLLRIEQGGPVGKLITVKLNEEQLKLLSSNELSIMIDDSVTYAGDGFSMDFAKLLINPTGKEARGNILGKVLDAETQNPISGANVQILDGNAANTDAEGVFKFNNLLAGLNVATASAKGYTSKSANMDVYVDETNEEIIIYLDKAQPIQINGKDLVEGDKLILNNIQFEQSKFDLLKDGKTELDKVVQVLLDNKNMEIELSGHTSNEGKADLNRTLSQQRADACKAYLVGKGIHPDRIKAIGYGPDKPIADNTTADGKVKNRRVELRVTRL